MCTEKGLKGIKALTAEDFDLSFNTSTTDRTVAAWSDHAFRAVWSSWCNGISTPLTKDKMGAWKEN